MDRKLICVLFSFLVLHHTYAVSNSVPYQVIIRLGAPYVTGEGIVANLCNGIIISQKYILTTAGCVHMSFSWSTMSPAAATSLYVVAGNFTISSNEGGIKRNVVSVIIHEKFNSTNYTNDIALLKLDRPIMMENTKNSSVSWIELQNSPSTTHYIGILSNCQINPQNSLGDKEYLYSIIPNISSVDPWFCNQNSTLTAEMCLLYATRNPLLCNTTEQALLRYSPERGTSLVCNNRVSGLLSGIQKPISIENCLTTGKTFASYISVADYIAWIKIETGLWTNASNEILPPSWTQMNRVPGKGNAGVKMEMRVMLVLLVSSMVMLVEMF